MKVLSLNLSQSEIMCSNVECHNVMSYMLERPSSAYNIEMLVLLKLNDLNFVKCVVTNTYHKSELF